MCVLVPFAIACTPKIFNYTSTMRASPVHAFHQTAAAALRRPWQTFRDGQIWYGLTKRGSKRHPLTTKQGNKHYYKGTGSSGIGSLDKAGVYHVNWDKVRTYVVPADINSTELRALVSPNTPEIYQRFEGYSDGAKSAELAWQNVQDFIEYGENYSDVDLEQLRYLEHHVHPSVVAAEQEQPGITKE